MPGKLSRCLLHPPSAPSCVASVFLDSLCLVCFALTSKLSSHASCIKHLIRCGLSPKQVICLWGFGTHGDCITPPPGLNRYESITIKIGNNCWVKVPFHASLCRSCLWARLSAEKAAFPTRGLDLTTFWTKLNCQEWQATKSLQVFGTMLALTPRQFSDKIMWKHCPRSGPSPLLKSLSVSLS